MNLTIEEIRELACNQGQHICNLPKNVDHPYEVGKNYFIRTVTHYYTGRLVSVFPQELVLEQAAWIADTGRFSTALTTGELNEVEPFPLGSKPIINRGSIIDAVVVSFEPPKPQK